MISPPLCKIRGLPSLLKRATHAPHRLPSGWLRAINELQTAMSLLLSRFFALPVSNLPTALLSFGLFVAPRHILVTAKTWVESRQYTLPF